MKIKVLALLPKHSKRDLKNLINVAVLEKSANDSDSENGTSNGDNNLRSQALVKAKSFHRRSKMTDTFACVLRQLGSTAQSHASPQVGSS